MTFLMLKSESPDESSSRDQAEILSIVSTESAHKLGIDGIDTLLIQMRIIVAQSPMKTETSLSPDKKSSVVRVVPDLQVASEIHCVRESSGWRVDLFATYADWRNMNTADAEKIFNRAREVGRRVSCMRNMKELSLGMMQYLQDNNDRYPPARQWHDAVMPYIQDKEVFHCPSVTSGKNGYAMNWKFSEKSESVVKEPAFMILLYESTALKTNHSGEGRDMAFRHMDGANMAFADGHVKWYKQHAEKNWPVIRFTFEPQK
jgi:prepilin-type processing-associated H-X9-DG protein